MTTSNAKPQSDDDKYKIPEDGSIPEFLKISAERRAQAWRENPPRAADARQSLSLGKKKEEKKKRKSIELSGAVTFLVKGNPCMKGSQRHKHYEILLRAKGDIRAFGGHGGRADMIKHFIFRKWIALKEK